MQIYLVDIRAYLATLAPDQRCGTTRDPRACLVHNALKHKYPGEVFSVTILDFMHQSTHENVTVTLLPEVADVVVGFDKVFSTGERTFDPVTRAQVEEAFPQLRTTAIEV